METVSKNRRGRPVKHDRSVLAIYGNLFPATSQRTLIEKALMMRAVSVLHDLGGCEWLVATADDVAAGRAKLRYPTALAALGRIDSDHDLHQLAKKLCREKPSARDAVGMVRRWREIDLSKRAMAAARAATK